MIIDVYIKCTAKIICFVFKTHIYLKLSLQDAGGVLSTIIIKTSLINNPFSKDPLKTG